MRRFLSGLAALIMLTSSVSGNGEELRSPASVGQILRAHGDEQIRPAGAADWQRVSAGQDLNAGDTLRTGPYGTLSVLFRDETQIRLHRNSLFEVANVRSVDAAGPSRFKLLSGSAWSRAKALLRTVAAQVTPDLRVIEIGTPTATIGIRGTDWHLSVEAGRSALTVLSGQADMVNEFGSVTVTGGELGIAEAGRAPSKRVIVDLRDRPLIVVETSLAWIDTLSITGKTSSELKAELEQLKADDDTAARLARAEAAYDLGHYTIVREEIRAIEQNAPAGEIEGRLRLLQGSLKLRERDYAEADRLLAAAQSQLNGRGRVIAQLGRAGVLIEQDQFSQAEASLKKLAAEQGEYAEVHLMRIWLASFSGDQQGAISQALEGERRFARDARFPALLAHLYFLTDQRAEMKAAFEAALSLDPQQLHAWHWKGLYHHFVEPDPEEAIAAYRQTIAINPNSSASWNNLGLVYFDLGDYQQAEHAMQEAVRSDPGSALAKANYGYILAFLDRLDEAEKLFRQAERLRADEPYGLLGIGYLDLYRGHPDRAVDNFLKAGTVDPELPGVNRALAAAYYQAGRFEEGKKELENARRFDPDDPIPYVLGSIFAVDHFEAGEGIRLAREGFQKTLKSESFAVESLSNARGGGATLGNAYSNLGMPDWGGYYTLLAFDPYLANGYFYLSQTNQFASEEARLGANRQGLLLDPEAVSSRTRYYDPFRQPFTDVTLFGRVGSSGGASNYRAEGVVQGFTRTPGPISYFVSGFRDSDDGFRANSDLTDELLSVALGSELNEKRHNLLFELFARRNQSGTPGADTEFADLDDRFNTEFIITSLGYQHRINFHNRVMLRVLGGTEHSETLAFNNFDGLSFFSGDSDQNGTLFQFQLRHLLDIGPVQFTWGSEWFTGDTITNSDFVVFDPFGGFRVPSDSFFRDLNSQVLYAQGRWKVTPDLWFDAGIFQRKLDIIDGSFAATSELDEEQVDPRLGVAWRVTPNHWLRAAAQRKLVLPVRAAETLAPVDTVGIVIEDQFFRFFDGGQSTDDYQVRWDSEWTPWLFTFARYNHQKIEDFSRSGFFFKDGELDIAELGSNVWFLERFGFRAAYLWLWSEDPADGLDLPLIQERQAELSLTWVHPRHIRASVFANYIGERWDDPLNTVRLEGFWNAGFFINWQPLRKHWSLGLAVNDLTDEENEFDKGFPGPGRSVFLSAEYRFGEDPAAADSGPGWPAFSTAEVGAAGSAKTGHPGPAAGAGSLAPTRGRKWGAEFGLDLSGGYREDSLDYNVASDISGTATPNIFEERSWDSLEITLFRADAYTVFGPGFYLTGSFAYGGVIDGQQQDSFFLSDNRTDEFFRQIATTTDEEVEDESVAGGYRFRLYGSASGGGADLIPLIGYSRHEQKLENTNGEQVIDTFGGSSGAFAGLRDTYQTEWEGPWVGVRANVATPRGLDFFASGEYHWADYAAQGDRNLSLLALQHPRSFEHEADGNGWVIAAGVNWYPQVLNRAREAGDGKGRWYVQLSGDWQDWKADGGTERLFFSDGTTFDSRLNEVNWESWSVNLGLGFRY